MAAIIIECPVCKLTWNTLETDRDTDCHHYVPCPECKVLCKLESDLGKAKQAGEKLVKRFEGLPSARANMTSLNELYLIGVHLDNLLRILRQYVDEIPF